MAISKKLRKEVYEKYSGRCAYTGELLDDTWQVDHIVPICFRIQTCHNIKSHDDIENLVPALRIINHYKRAQGLEDFRRYIQTLHLRLQKLPKKTIVKRTEERIKYLKNVASKFGVDVDKPFDGKFYFEKLINNKS